MTITITFGLLVLITIGIVEAFKGLGVPTKWCPFIAITIGLVLSFLAFLVKNQDLVQFILVGLIIGLSAVGLFSSSKTVVEGFIKKKEPDQPTQ